MGGKTGGGVKGYRYAFGIHMGISRGPVDELIEIKVGDKTAWRGSVTANGTVNIDAYNLFGGDDAEGGVEGTLQVMMGGPTQTAPSELGTVLKTPMPGFRRMFTLFFDGIISAINPYPKPWKTRQRRTLAGWDGSPWYPERATISLTRPVSEGETQGSSETKNVTMAVKLTCPATAPFTVTLAPDGPLVSVNSCYFQSTSGTGEFEGTTRFELTGGVDYTVSGNDITFTPRPETESYTPINYANREVWVDFTYTLTTVNPNAGLGDGLIQAMNPAHIIYECLTNREWGRGLSSSAIDLASFTSAADTLYDERFGMCIRWNRRDTIQSFVQMVLDHIGATLYTDRTTALIAIRLYRYDYDQPTMTLYDTSNGVLEITEATVSATAPKINEVQVQYRDPVTDQDRVVRATNLATLQSAGGEINTTKLDFPGIPTSEIATRVAKRELRGSSTSLRRFSITMDRRGFALIPGGVMRIQDLPRNIPDMVLRIAQIDYGSPKDGRIKITAMQDVFGLPSKGFTPMPPPQWTPPRNEACVAEHRVFELPYRSVYKNVSAADLAYIVPATAFLGVVSKEGNPLNMSYKVAVKNGAVDDGTEWPADDQYYCGYVPPV